MTTQVKAVSRVLLAADGWLLTSTLAAQADMLEKPTHVSAILNNLRARDFIQSEKGVHGGSEQQHRVFEPNRAKFIAWVDRDSSAVGRTSDEVTKRRATNKSEQMHRIELATRKTATTTRTLSQMASEAERSADERDDFAKIHGGVEHRVIRPPAKASSIIAEPAAQTTIREFCSALSQVLGIPASWLRVSISIDSGPSE